ncbi:hypothetical protein, partial [Streptomyces sp. DH12]|uniref:CurL C-terminal domain-containing protein n=1 Tax=Streptomyces sp. DH12 TaxID=2857010 RepID=UPI001E6518B4
MLSAHTETALRELAGALAGAVEPLSLPDVVHTLREGRSHRRTRLVVGATTTGELRDKIREFAADGRFDDGDVPDAY